MQVRIRLAAPVLFTLLVLASSRALNHMDQPLALLLIVPGYVVQAWLFEAHRGLGGAGDVVTMVGGLALVWARSEEHTSEIQSPLHIVCPLLLLKKKKKKQDKH